MRLQEKETTDYKTKEIQIYPEKGGVLIDFFKDLFNTSQYGSEEGQIRTIAEEEKSVKFYSTILEGNRFFEKLNKAKYNINEDDKGYSIAVADFSTSAIDRLRNRGDLANVKDFLMKNAGIRMEEFLSE